MRRSTASAAMLLSLHTSRSVAGSSTTLLAAEEPETVVLEVDSVADPQLYRDNAVQEHSVVHLEQNSTLCTMS